MSDAAKLAEEIKEQRADIRALAGWIRKHGPCPRCADKERDLAMAMMELQSVAKERDDANLSPFERVPIGICGKRTPSNALPSARKKSADGSPS